MGFYRLLLAYLVVDSHVGIAILGFNPGEVAVVSFFLLSGYVMTALVDRHYSQPGRLCLFYLDRAARLFPQFLFYSLATIAAAQMGLRHEWMKAAPSGLSDLVQLTMLPLNFAMHFPDMLLPQAWSLGLEAMFYLVFPLVLIPGKRLPYALGSAAVFGLAAARRLPAEWFGYRLLPGVLFVFLLGSWIQRPDPRFGRAPLVIAFALALVGLAAGLTVWPLPVAILDVFAGLALGLPAVYALARLRLSPRFDALAGDLSYGVFLNHNLLLPMVAALLPGVPRAVLLVALIPVSTAAAYASFRRIEQPALAWRRRLRHAPATAALETAAA